MTIESTFNKTIKAAHEADVCQALLEEMEFRGVTDHIALSVVRQRRNAADRHYKQLSAEYRILATSAATREP